MPDPRKTPSHEPANLAESGRPEAARRRLLQGGLAAAPVLMTLVSRPVLGQVVTPSAFVSGNASRVAASATSSGRTPEYWKQDQNFYAWPHPYYPTSLGGPGGHSATLFDKVFTPHYSGKTLLDVLSDGSGPPNDVAGHVVAALLNIAAGLTPVITVQTVKDIWTEYITTGYYEPTAGTHWDHGQIVTYLDSTMPA